MRAVIVAAGLGTRMGDALKGRPKCLLEMEDGRSILEYTLDVLRELGVGKIVVATRPEFVEMIRERVGGRAEVTPVYVEEGYGNLYTLYQATLDLWDDILAVMSDHLVEPSIVKKLLEEGGERAITLCLDRRPSRRNLEEGLKIRCQDGRVLEAGKELKEFHGVDTGLFVISRRGLGLVRELVETRGPGAEFVDLINYAAGRGEAGYVDVTGSLWMDIDTPEDLEEARRLYWRILRKRLHRDWDGPISTLINRRVSTRLSTLLYRKTSRITPNHVSMASFLLALLSALLIWFESLVLGGLLAQLSSILDGVDGELARLRGVASRLGGFLDTVLDRFADLSIIAALGYQSLPLLPPWATIILTALAASGIILVSYISVLSRGLVEARRLRRGFPWPTRDVRLFMVMVGGLLEAPLIPLLYIAASSPIFAVKALILSVRGGGVGGGSGEGGGEPRNQPG